MEEAQAVHPRVPRQLHPEEVSASRISDPRARREVAGDLIPQRMDAELEPRDEPAEMAVEEPGGEALRGERLG